MSRKYTKKSSYWSKFYKKKSINEEKPKEYSYLEKSINEEKPKEYSYLVQKSTKGTYNGSRFTTSQPLEKGIEFNLKNRLFKIIFINNVGNKKNLFRIMDSNITLFVKKIK